MGYPLARSDEGVPEVGYLPGRDGVPPTPPGLTGGVPEVGYPLAVGPPLARSDRGYPTLGGSMLTANTENM